MKLFLTIALCTLSNFSFSQITATTSEGKKVILNKNGTWKYVTEKNVTGTNSSTTKNITIEPFTTDEVNEYGNEPGCQYSNTKGGSVFGSGKPIFIRNDISGITVMKINDKIIKLKAVKEYRGDEKETEYVGDSFTISIHIEKIKPLEHVATYNGYLIIKSQNSGILKVEIWGGCGD